MKREIKCLKIIVLVFMVLINATACEVIDENDDLIDFTNDISTSKSIEVSDNSNLALVEYTEKQIVISICMEIFYNCSPIEFTEADAIIRSESMMSEAEKLSEKILGEVVSEEDAIKKARGVFIELGYLEIIEKIESDFIEVNGEKMSYQRSKPPYTVKFYEGYDAWLIMSNPPSGIREDGKGFDSTGPSLYVIIRGSDGKLLALL